VKLEDMGSKMTDDQFMIHVLNNITSDYEIQNCTFGKRELETNPTCLKFNLSFDRMSTTKNWFASGAKHNPISIKSAGSVIDPGKHHYDWKLSGKLEVSQACASANKFLKEETRIQERNHIDISTIKGNSFEGSKLWT
jgi:hypothetical protein